MKVVKIINHTGDNVIIDLGDCFQTLDPEGDPIRLEYERVQTGGIGSIPLLANKLKGHNLPGKKEGIFLLVSAMILQAFPERDDLIAIDDETTTKNTKGKIISVRGFIQNRGVKE